MFATTESFFGPNELLKFRECINGKLPEFSSIMLPLKNASRQDLCMEQVEDGALYFWMVNVGGLEVGIGNGGQGCQVVVLGCSMARRKSRVCIELGV
ncbi:hypothetical protein PIB30_024718 [Stylosanthes scabra]|uniref:Uncharacterized protein n=1 Tax=Stylosanthes scabra TaxID=79078 RepID=A0ABU6RA43_9FABA|nr:hypothetical protein [Stylosanthes scabra]